MKKKIFQTSFLKRISLVQLILAIILINLVVLDFSLFNDSFIKDIKNSISANIEASQRTEIFEQVNPSKGYDLNIKYSDLGPKLLSLGVVDLDKFKSAQGQLSDLDTKILTQGSDEKIKITRENSHFLLNFFWAVGLSNNTSILTEGDMARGGSPANYASTGGWTLGKDNSMNYYSKSQLINLSPQQEALVLKVASGIYRPCCGNSTAFPDCNHGMALLGALELMAANGATENQMFEAAKYINAFWFPSNYYDLAKYFKQKEGKNFSEIDAKLILGKDYSSSTGYAAIKQWLEEKEGKVQNTGGGVSCGV